MDENNNENGFNSNNKRSVFDNNGNTRDGFFLSFMKALAVSFGEDPNMGDVFYQTGTEEMKARSIEDFIREIDNENEETSLYNEMQTTFEELEMGVIKVNTMERVIDYFDFADIEERRETLKTLLESEHDSEESRKTIEEQRAILEEMERREAVYQEMLKDNPDIEKSLEVIRTIIADKKRMILEAGGSIEDIKIDLEKDVAEEDRETTREAVKTVTQAFYKDRIQQAAHQMQYKKIVSRRQAQDFTNAQRASGARPEVIENDGQPVGFEDQFHVSRGKAQPASHPRHINIDKAQRLVRNSMPSKESIEEAPKQNGELEDAAVAPTIDSFDKEMQDDAPMVPGVEEEIISDIRQTVETPNIDELAEETGTVAVEVEDVVQAVKTETANELVEREERDVAKEDTQEEIEEEIADEGPVGIEKNEGPDQSYEEKEVEAETSPNLDESEPEIEVGTDLMVQDRPSLLQAAIKGLQGLLGGAKNRIQNVFGQKKDSENKDPKNPEGGEIAEDTGDNIPKLKNTLDEYVLGVSKTPRITSQPKEKGNNEEEKENDDIINLDI